MGKITGNEPIQPHYKMEGGKYYIINSGLTIRQHFAAMCLQGMLSNPVFTDLVMKRVAIGNQAKYISGAAIEQADALIAELNK